jgi:hypothetical protein
MKSNKITVRLFYTSACSGGSCCCGPNLDIDAFQKLAGQLVKKYGEDAFEFEAINSTDLKKFPYLGEAIKSVGKASGPIVAVNEKVVSSGKFPSFAELSKTVAGFIKVD